MVDAMPTAGCNGGSCGQQHVIGEVLKLSSILLQIWSLPKLTLVFSSTSIASLQPSIIDSFDPPALSVPQDTQRRVPGDFDIEQALIAPMGEASPLLHLLVSVLAPLSLEHAN